MNLTLDLISHEIKTLMNPTLSSKKINNHLLKKVQIKLIKLMSIFYQSKRIAITPWNKI